MLRNENIDLDLNPFAPNVDELYPEDYEWRAPNVEGLSEIDKEKLLEEHMSKNMKASENQAARMWWSALRAKHGELRCAPAAMPSPAIRSSMLYLLCASHPLPDRTFSRVPPAASWRRLSSAA